VDVLFLPGLCTPPFFLLLLLLAREEEDGGGGGGCARKDWVISLKLCRCLGIEHCNYCS
jgi:hypothetical protein